MTVLRSNLDAFEDGADTILDHHLQIDGSKVIELDSNALPTSKFIDVGETPFDFRKEQTIGGRWDDTVDLCGKGCQGYDNAWVYDKTKSKKSDTSLWSDKSGIRYVLFSLYISHSEHARWLGWIFQRTNLQYKSTHRFG